jgi:hypothetical protein
MRNSASRCFVGAVESDAVTINAACLLSLRETLRTGDAMDASLPTGKESRPLNAEGHEQPSVRNGGPRACRGGSSDGYGIKVPMA